MSLSSVEALRDFSGGLDLLTSHSGFIQRTFGSRICVSLGRYFPPAELDVRGGTKVNACHCWLRPARKSIDPLHKWRLNLNNNT